MNCSDEGGRATTMNRLARNSDNHNYSNEKGSHKTHPLNGRRNVNIQHGVREGETKRTTPKSHQKSLLE